MLNMFSIYYKTKLKNKLKNKIQKLVNALSSSLSLRQQLSLAPHISRSSYNNSSSNNALSLSPYLHPTTLSLGVSTAVLHLCRCYYFVSATATASSPPPPLLRLDCLNCCCSLSCVSYCYLFYLSNLSKYFLEHVNMILLSYECHC